MPFRKTCSKNFLIHSHTMVMKNGNRNVFCLTNTNLTVPLSKAFITFERPKRRPDLRCFTISFSFCSEALLDLVHSCSNWSGSSTLKRENAVFYRGRFLEMFLHYGWTWLDPSWYLISQVLSFGMKVSSDGFILTISIGKYERRAFSLVLNFILFLKMS